jgi:hypothetical protein
MEAARTDDFVAQDVFGDLTLSDVPRPVEPVARAQAGAAGGMPGLFGFAQNASRLLRIFNGLQMRRCTMA